MVVGEDVAAGRQAELLGGRPAYAFAVHRQQGCVGGRGHVEAFLLQLHEGRGGNRLDLRDDVVRAFLLNDFAESGAVKH